MQPESSMELLYATQFSVDSYEGGYELIQIQDDGKYLVVPETMPVPEGVPDSITVLQKPLDHVYLAATLLSPNNSSCIHRLRQRSCSIRITVLSVSRPKDFCNAKVTMTSD